MALDEPHGVVVGSALASDAIYVHHMGMVQGSGGHRLVLESLELPRVESSGKRKHLEGYPAAKRDLLRFVNDPHSAASDFPEKSEVAEPPGLVARRPGGTVGALQCGSEGLDGGFKLYAGSEELGQLVRELRVSRHQHRRRVGRASVCPIEIAGQDLREPILACIGGVRSGGHTRSSSSNCRNRRMPRTRSPATARLVRPIASPVSESE